jgi:N-acyl-D-amino-acid deacylase
VAEYDLVIQNATIVDGTGKPGAQGSVAVQGERIAAVGAAPGTAAATIDGSGLVVCPGFVDPHSHADMSIYALPKAENLIMQGITTFVGGQCGQCPAPVASVEALQRILDSYGVSVKADWRTFGEWLARVEGLGISPNYAPLVGHNSIRGAVMGDDFKRHATQGEIAQMRTLVEDAMDAGAHGLSSFFDPSPGEYCSLDEIVELATVAGRYGGVYFPHTRHIQSQWSSGDLSEYGYGIFHGPTEDIMVGRYRGYLEAIEIAIRARTRLHIPHLSPAFIIPQPHPGYLDEAAAYATLELLDRARAEGLEVTFDTIPCTSSIAGLASLMSAFGRWSGPLGKDRFVSGLKTKALRDEIKQVREGGRLKLGMIHTKADPYWSDCFTIQTCSDKSVEGKLVSDLAFRRRADPLDVLFDLLVVDAETTWAQTSDKRMMPMALPVMLKHELGMPCTDVMAAPAKATGSGDTSSPYGNMPPAIAYGLYPHYLGTYVRDTGALTLEEAVMKATSRPAQVLGLKDRGVLQAGAYADVVLFDLKTVRMRGTMVEPNIPPSGIHTVIVNGQVVYKDMAHTGARPGKVLRRA